MAESPKSSDSNNVTPEDVLAAIKELLLVADRNNTNIQSAAQKLNVRHKVGKRDRNKWKLMELISLSGYLRVLGARVAGVSLCPADGDVVVEKL